MQPVIDERRILSRNGFLVVVVTLDKYTGGLIGEPQIITRGFVYEAESAEPSWSVRSRRRRRPSSWVGRVQRSWSA